jgi:PKD repeat protein
MSFIGWGGADPPSVADPADYELGTKYVANSDVTVTHARVYGAADSGTLANRRARLWNSAGSLLTTAVLPDTLLPGWNLYEFATPQDITTGQTFYVSYSVIGGYGAGVHALDTDVTSPNGDVTCPAGGNGVLNFTPAQFPSVGSNNSSFFGIDIGFDESGSTAPVIGSIDTDVSNLSVSATANVTDAETLIGATYTFDWGDGTVTSQDEVTASHTYATAGLYALLVIATDASGLTDSMAVPLLLTAPVAPGSLLPNNDLVARAWVGSISALPANKVGLSLPSDETTWESTGFVQLRVTGGSPDPDIPERAPVIEVNCYAVKIGSSKAPWNLASQLAEIIVNETYRTDAAARLVNPGTNYGFALVQSATVVSEIRRITSDVGSYAHVQFDLALRWRHAS